MAPEGTRRKRSARQQELLEVSSRVREPEAVPEPSGEVMAMLIRRLKQRFPQIEGPAKEDICYATQNRQEAVRILAGQADLVLVVGSRNSSNSQRLVEIANNQDVPAYLIDGPDDIRPDWFSGEETVVITAGASAPEGLVERCVAWLRGRFQTSLRTHRVREENVRFQLPRELRG